MNRLFAHRFWWLSLVLCLLLAAGYLVWSMTHGTQVASGSGSAMPTISPEGGYVGSTSCESCHEDYYNSWHASYHRTMTQPVSTQTVLGDFDQPPLECNGQQCQFERRGDEFWVKMPDPDWQLRQEQQGRMVSPNDVPPTVDRKVVMLTGSHHFQVYWVGSELHNGLWEVPWVWSIADEQWYPAIHTGINPPSTQVSMQLPTLWNEICLMCHSVAGNPNFDFSTRRFQTRVAELGIACEACHGPGERHVQLQQQKAKLADAAAQTAMADTDMQAEEDGIVNPKSCSPEASSRICGQCHSAFHLVQKDRFWNEGIGYRPGEDLSRTHELLRFGHGDRQDALTFWSDGTCRVGGDEYNGMIASGCYQRGDLSCLSCHSMHDSDPNDQLATWMDGNEACLQCHESFRDRLAEHTHHPAESSGSLCYNCHMPFTSYALLKAIRSHRVDSPDIASSIATGRPNACNLCHLDKTLAWSAQHTHQWYEAAVPDLDKDRQETAASLLWLTRGDAVQRAIVAWHFGWEEAQKASGDQWQAPFLALLLEDSYSAVRYLAQRSLRTLPGFEDFEYTHYATRDQLKLARQRATGIWARENTADTIAERQHLLLAPSGDLQQVRLESLLRQRVDPPIFIAE